MNTHSPSLKETFQIRFGSALQKVRRILFCTQQVALDMYLLRFL